ncbi:hypothetical protein [Endozoicomonas ascidiicola]|uniref:hypothetical protein n=1 Tax=Endozoicomonas ascidiicola TaxID=1698521 RepID=UPI000834B786|nr:hypothetical protein [Endozoicomonas ascidiicola]
MNVFDKEHSHFAAKQLRLADGEWELVYQSVEIPFIYDSSDVTEQLKKEHGDDSYEFGVMDIEVAVREAINHIPLSVGVRLVGFKRTDSDERYYGIVDFSSIERLELSE